MMQLTAALSGLLMAAATAHPAAHKIKTQLGSSAAFDRHGVLWLVGADDGKLVARTSSDDGNSWRPAVILSDEAAMAGGDERPRIAFGPRDEVYITYSRPLEKPWTSEIRFLRSEDGGVHFSAPYTVHHDHQIVTHGFASLAVDTQGRVYVTWIDKRNAASVAQYYAVSTDAGRSFGADYKIADHSCECCRSAIALAPDGRPALMWRHVFEPNIRDHAIVTLAADGRPAPPERASFDHWAIDACPHQGPALAYGEDGRRHQTWFTGDGLFYASRRQDGTLTMPLRLGDEQASNADIAVSGQRVEVVWKAFDGKVTAIKALSSRDGGASWQARTLAATDGGSDQPRLARKDGRIFLIWRTDRNDITTVEL
ncbi:sialidase family protein [Duganella callida]|uniref:Exo-alpha-sialidase n=1 Tax=Duganella callida TaxID=2561932 RepID=A0A4Y9SEG3_9BURK|nr:sialidase family protein [Duganella callida]TFW21428.1 exo-alpha-sialidase [Duganella callida]